MIIYVSGPMTGIEDYNRPMFNIVSAYLEAFGHQVINPAVPDLEIPDDAPHHVWMRRALGLLLNAEAIYMLPGWYRSKGAVVEYLVARSCGMAVVGYASGASKRITVGVGKGPVEVLEFYDNLRS